VPKKPNPAPRQFNVGDKIHVNMHAGKIVGTGSFETEVTKYGNGSQYNCNNRDEGYNGKPWP
jgi:hypothetical protein